MMFDQVRRRRISRSSALLLAAAAFVLFPAGCKGKPGVQSLLPSTDPVPDKIQTLASQSTLDGMHWHSFADFQPQIQAFYQDRSFAAAWVKDHQPTAAASAFIHQFETADQKGLIPDDYDASLWPGHLHELAAKTPDADAAFDLELTVAAARYLSHVHQGRINPTHLNFEIDTASKALDLQHLLAQRAVDCGDVPALVTSLEPDNETYRKTEQALQTYLQLQKKQAASPQLAAPLPDVTASVAPGGHYPAVADLVTRLQLESSAALATGQDGVAASDSTTPGTTYTPEIAARIKTFQRTHGLTADGKLTSATIAALNVPMSQRVLQLDDALERWRWLPEPYLHPALLVNLPEFMLRGYSGVAGSSSGSASGASSLSQNDTGAYQLDFSMKAIVGKAEGGHDTPVFTHMMRFLIFRPFWNVPESIIKKELMAHISKSGIGYLAAKGYETVNSKGEHVDASAETVSHGGVVVREKPGARNALGLVKFMFPNQYDIYIHSTNEAPLFARTRRDLSHGCIRVQDPTALAVWVLRNQGGDPWDSAKVTEAMQTGPDSHTVSLKTALPVTIQYFTAFVNENGEVDFFSDIYGYDDEMNQLLTKGMPYPNDVVKINPHTTPGDTI